MRLLLALASVALAAAKTDYTGYSVVSTVMSLDSYRTLEENEDLEVWRANFVNASEVEVDLFLSPSSSFKALKQQVKVADFQSLVDAEAERIAKAPAFDPERADDTFFLEFRNYNDQLAYFNSLVARYPDLARPFRLGATVEGRVINGMSVTASPSPSVAIYIQACVHAREWLAPAATFWVIKSLLEGYGSNEQITRLLNTAVFHIVPVVNIDGYLFTWSNTRLWRKNRRNNGGSFGVDINRNWGPANLWCTAGSSRTPSSDTYCGTAAFSEPETAAAGAFIDSNRNIRAAVDMHTYGPLLLWPWQYTLTRIPTADFTMFTQLGARMASAINAVAGQRYVSQQGSLLYPHSGGLVDYAWTDKRIKSFTFEGRGTNFVVPPSNIIPAGREQFAGILVMAEDAVATELAKSAKSATA